MASLEVDATFKIDDDGEDATAVRTLRASDFRQLPTGAATSAKQDSAKAVLDAIAATVADTLSVESRPATITDAVYDSRGNLTSWTENDVAYEATYDADDNLLTQGPA